jgi:ADP-heptose:LPS heptosyltransferase
MPPNHQSSILGYDTRSCRSALVMRAVDAINPFKKAEPFSWQGPCVVSSVAGLGDLFIHLPLIGGIVHAGRERGLNTTVALRPAHARIGRQCGWEVLPFDNGLEDFFKNPSVLRFSEFCNTIRTTRKERPALWIDLTGNAISALAIKVCRAKKLAARTTRGGRSLVDHPLPHVIQENEYQNRLRVADYLGCRLDLRLPARLMAGLPREHSGSVVLCLSTASRWKNWPLVNFRALVERFPETHFTVVGLRREVLSDELEELDRIVRQPNVANCFDRLSIGELVGLIAHCRAVVTNDTSAAHIANFFGKPGAVLFGPVSPQTFAAPDGLRVFHDATCPYHPCVQWRCDNQANWCMRKLNPTDVAAHLANVLDSTPRSMSSMLPARTNASHDVQAKLAAAGAASSIGAARL